MARGEVAIDLFGLTRWLSELSNARVDPRALRIARPTGGGWSNDTFFVDTALPQPARVVVRLAPDGPSMFPTYNLSRQVTVMQEVSRAGRVRVPNVLGVDLGGDRLGRPAFVMSFVGGRVPVDDRPSFAEAGFLFDAVAEDQRVFHLGLIDAIANVHASLTPVLVESLKPLNQATLGHALAELSRTWQFDRGDHWSNVVDESLGALAGRLPPPTIDVLVWGDARPANVIVPEKDFVPVALLDWELATVGPPELDITWLAEMNRMRMQGSGVAPLPGFLSDDEAVDHYQKHSGRVLNDLPWHRLLSATRIAVLMHRHLRVMVHLGRLPATHRLLSRTIATDRVAQLMGFEGATS